MSRPHSIVSKLFVTASTFAVLALLAIVPACPGSSGDDDDDDDDDDDGDAGFTDCGDETCQPGQYCEDQTFSVCENGCTSDANCLDDSSCEDISDVLGVGTCAETGGEEGEGEGGGNPLADCQAACDHFQECGLPAGDAAQCRTDCGGLTEDQQIVIGNCEDTSCAAAPGCLGVDCFSTDDCGVDEECVGNSCL